MGSRPCLLVCLALMAAASAASQDGKIAWSPAPGRYSSARVGLSLPAGASAEYRFSGNGDGIWRPFSEALALTAFPREERTFDIQARVRRGAELTETEARYVIDRQPPDAPQAVPLEGSYEGSIELRLSAEKGAVIFYTLQASDRPSSGFKVYDPDSPPLIDRPKDGTRAWILSAYAVDDSGNPGPLMAARYLIEPNPSGAAAQARPVSSTAMLSNDGGLKYTLERRAPGVTRLVFSSPESLRVFAAVNPPKPEDRESYTELPLNAGMASMELTAPPGWTGPLSIRYAVWKDGQLLRAPQPVEVSFAYDDPSEPPPSPPEPIATSLPGTQTVLLSWEPFPFRIELAVGQGAFVPYMAPVSIEVPDGLKGIQVQYRSVGLGGAFSEIRTLSLAPTRSTSMPEISGIPREGLANGAVSPRAPLGAIVRYEVSTGGLPSSVTVASALLDESASFPGEDGKELRYTLRLRAFSDSSPNAEGSDERFISFVVDRLTPPAPRLSAGSLEGDAEADRVIAFEPGEGTIRFAVSEKGSGEDAVFKDYKGPVLLEGSGEKAVAYEVYAYAVDAAGNRSETVGPVSVRIDRASVYVASWGSDANTGGPRNPLASLSEGVSAAVRAGKRFVRVQGDVQMGGVVRPEGDIEILGACDESWEPVPGVKSRAEASGVPGPLFAVNGVDIVVRNISLSVDHGGDFTLVEVTKGGFSASGLDVRLSVSGEATFIRSRESSIEIEDSSLSLRNASFARVVDAHGGRTRVDGFAVSAEEGIGYFTGFSFEGGLAAVSGLRSRTTTAGGFTLVRSVGARTDVRDTYITADGTGYCEVFRSVGGRTSVYLTTAVVRCGGPLTFVSLEGATGDILHATVSLSSGSEVFLSLKDSTARVGNSILLDEWGGGTFLRTDSAVKRGAIVRNAISGFRSFVSGPNPAATIDALNSIAAPPDGLNFEESLETSKLKAVSGMPALSALSQGRDGAYPLEIPPPPLGAFDPGGARRDVGAFEAPR